MTRESRAGRCLGFLLHVGPFIVMAASGLSPTVASAEESIIFLQDGRTIRADKTEIIGDRIRIHEPAEMIEIPRSDVLSIHPVTPPRASPATPPPVDVYREVTPQMADKIRREIPEPGAPRGK